MAISSKKLSGMDELTRGVASVNLSSNAKKNPAAVLNDIIKQKISLDPEATKKSVEIIEKFVKDGLINELKVDPLFKLLFNTVYHTGSYFDGLRVGEATEFDLNLLMDLSKIQKALDFSQDKHTFSPGFMRLGLTTRNICDVTAQPDWNEKWPLFLKKLTKQESKDTFLHPAKMSQWMQSVVDKVDFKNLKTKYPEIVEVKVSNSGPAKTLKIKTRFSPEIDVDLVPALYFSNSVLVNYPKTYEILTRNNWVKERFFLIPKKSSDGKVNSELLWRMDFHDLENKVINKNPTSKTIIRLLKAFRDSNQMLFGVSSYALKTIVMDMIQAEATRWGNADLVPKFLEALQNFQTKLREEKISYLFQPDCDVLWRMNPVKRAEASTWLDKQIKELKRTMDTDECRQVWLRYFGLSYC